MTDFEPRERRIPIPAEGEGERIEQAGLDYANGINQSAEELSVPDPTDEAARLGIDLEEYHQG